MTDDSNSRPPRKGQFQPGQSGNPRGRPKGHKNLQTYVHEELAEKVEIVVQGRTKKVSKAQVIAIQTVNKASTGDPKAIATILGMTRDQDHAPTNRSLSVLARAEDTLVMAGIVARIRATAAPADEEGDPPAVVAADDRSYPGADPIETEADVEGAA